MATRRERTIVVGAFVAGTAVVLTIGVLWLAGSRFLRPVDRYFVIFKGSVSGLSPGAAVELNGVQVGKVTSVDLTNDSPPRVRVDLEVQPRTPIYQDTVAQLSGNIVTGIQFIELTGGSRQSGMLGEDEAIRSSESSFSDIRRQAVKVSEETYQLVTGLNNDTLNQQNRIALGQTIQNLAATSKNLKDVTTDLAQAARLRSINTMIANLSQASVRLNAASARADVAMAALAKHSDQTLKNFNELLTKVSGTASTAQTLLATSNGIVNRNSEEIDRAVGDISRVSRHLDDAIQNIQADPSVLIWGTRVPARENAQ
jgi:phospholipid/cholesterol/gamma-HCH transport system substrate-binding protein